MIKGIGIDIIEISRVTHLLERQPRFPKRILTERELQYYHSLSETRQVEYLSGRFAVKEAFAKAYGTGIGAALSFQDIETAIDEKGKPFITKPIQTGVHVSITHSRAFAAAQVIIEKLK